VNFAKILSTSISNPVLKRYINHYSILTKNQLVRATEKLVELRRAPFMVGEKKSIEIVLKLKNAHKEFFSRLKDIEKENFESFDKKRVETAVSHKKKVRLYQTK
jgi:hypothetical protein